MRFVDTNVLLYAASTAPGERPKARIPSAKTVLTEDLAHGQDYDGVTVQNPFAR